MTKPITPSALKAKLQEIIDRDNATLAELSESDNPVVIGLRKEILSRKVALEAVLYALNGNHVFLNILE